MIKTKKHYIYFNNEKIYQYLGQSETLLMKLNDLKFYISYNLTAEEDPKLKDLTLTKLPKTDLNAIIVSYIHLLEGVAVEAVKRISIKELDYFLRENPKVSAFSFYSPDLYKILNIGEELYKKHLGAQVNSEETLLDNNSLAYSELSFSEQAELLEEFLSKYVYKHSSFKNQDFELQDVDSHKLYLKYSGEVLTQDLKTLIVKMLKKEFKVDAIIDQDKV